MAAAGAAHDGEKLARGLGWLSVGLGLAEVLAPRAVSRAIGVPERRLALSAFGLREIAAGVGILSKRRPAGWLWGRVLGDAIDLAALARAARSPLAQRGRVALASASVLGVTFLDVVAAARVTRGAGPPRVQRSIGVNRPPEIVYAFWKDPKSLPLFMSGIESVRPTGERRAHFTARAVLGAAVGVRLGWEAEVVADEPNVRIAWRSLASGPAHTLDVRFEIAEGGKATTVRVEAEAAGGGPVRGALGRVLGASVLAQDLRRMKQLLETSEIATSEGPVGRCTAS